MSLAIFLCYRVQPKAKLKSSTHYVTSLKALAHYLGTFKYVGVLLKHILNILWSREFDPAVTSVKACIFVLVTHSKK